MGEDFDPEFFEMNVINRELKRLFSAGPPPERRLLHVCTKFEAHGWLSSSH
jgi:hypothetical protein